MSDNNVIKGQAWISGNKLLQDQIIDINGNYKPDEDMVIYGDIMGK